MDNIRQIFITIFIERRTNKQCVDTQNEIILCRENVQINRLGKTVCRCGHGGAKNKLTGKLQIQIWL